jgi:hypothetical protein
VTPKVITFELATRFLDDSLIGSISEAENMVVFWAPDYSVTQEFSVGYKYSPKLSVVSL